MIVICDRCNKQSRPAYEKLDGQRVPGEANQWISLYNPRDKDRYFLCPDCEEEFNSFMKEETKDAQTSV